MESSSSSGTHRYTLDVKTGKYKGATLYGDIIIRFHPKQTQDEVDAGTAPLPRHRIGGLFKAGKNRTVRVDSVRPIREIDEIEVWLERPYNKADVKWFVEYIRILDDNGTCVKYFPFHRWVTMIHQMIRVNNAILPQHDSNQQRRNEAIHLEKSKYYFSARVADAIPILTEVELSPEDFSIKYFTEVFVLGKVKGTLNEKLRIAFTKHWQSLSQLDNIYAHFLGSFKKPKIAAKYMEVIPQDDWSPLDKVFGAQRLIGTNPAVIQRVRSLDRLKESMNLSDEESFKRQMKMSLTEAIEGKKLYMVDYTVILQNIICKNGMIASPIALFYVNGDDNLMPVAIQLFKHNAPAGPDNPVFFPDDNKYTWMLAKMWFNNADASFHQSSSHLGFTHLMMETIYLALRQTVSISHPLYHLMAPHFLYLLKVNETAFSSLINDGGWVDSSMTIGVKGMYEIIRRRYQGYQTPEDDVYADVTEETQLHHAWRLDREGNLENDIKARGVEDLPKYYFRDDALAVYRVIKKYVSAVVNPHYKDIDTLTSDYELQQWAALLSATYEQDGCQLQGVPGRGKFSTQEQLIDTITSVIYISSVAHASVNFLQYEQYGFPLNYPALLYGEPPRKKIQNEHDEIDILQCLATKKNVLGMLTITKLLSSRATKPLGDFEIEYQFDEIGTNAVKQFQKDLHQIQEDHGKDKKKEAAYEILKPIYIPNAISI